MKQIAAAKSRKTLKQFSKILHHLTGAYRDPRYAILTALAVPLLLIAAGVAIQNHLKIVGVELSLFRTINGWPAWLLLPLYAITQFGSLAATVIWASVATYLRNIKAGGVVLLAGVGGWLLAKPLKIFVDRGRPDALLHGVNTPSTEHFTGLGFPSGHATVSAACATALLLYVRPRYRKYVLLVVLLVGISRVYLGGHLPGDIVGGWLLGAIVGSVVSLVFGVQRKTVSLARIKKRMQSELGIDAIKARTLSLDARGSIPIRVWDGKNREYFVKLFGREEHAADWIFKVMRYFRYKSFTDEEPYFNAKRNVEHEALVGVWAARAGVNTPRVVGYTRVGSYWLLAQESLTGKPLDHIRTISDKTLQAAWHQVKLLHDASIAHRDLRAANMLIDEAGKPWVIDYGFAEVASSRTHRLMDIAEFLMSTALVTTPERTIKAARQVLGKDSVLAAAPYVQMAVFSGATTTLARNNKHVYKALRELLANMAGENGEIEEVKVQRVSLKMLFNLTLLGIFMLVVIPQFKQFRGAFEALDGINNWWLLPILAASALTYVSAALSLVSLAPIPLGVRRTLLVQVASSYASKALPSGLGGAALFVRFLRREGMDVSSGTALMVGQRLIGAVMFFVPLGALLVLQGESVRELFHIKIDPIVVYAVLGVLALAAVLLIVHAKLRMQALQAINNVKNELQELAGSPRELMLSALFSFGTTAAYVFALWFALQAVGVHLNLLAVIIVYATATLLGTASPAPGGLGAFEVAMVAALIGMRVPHGDAYAAVILYRLATYWAPIPFGFLAYQLSEKKRIL